MIIPKTTVEFPAKKISSQNNPQTIELDANYYFQVLIRGESYIDSLVFDERSGNIEGKGVQEGVLNSRTRPRRK